MAYDPNFPASSVLIESAAFRQQFQALKALIDAIGSVTGAQVTGTTTLPPGSAAQAGVVLQSGVLKFSFGVPAGETGLAGTPGPPFAQAVVDSVTTLPPGSAATVAVSFDGTDVHFHFGLPQGEAGTNGEVLASQLAAEIMTTSSNTNAVGTLDSPFGDPDMEALRQKMNELILALRR